MSLGFSASLRDARAQQILAAVDAGGGSAKLRIYTAAKPATGAAITDQVLLSELLFSSPAGSVTGGVLSFAAITEDASADASGQATWARVVDSTDAFVMDLSVGATGSGAEIELNTVEIIAGGPVSISSASITEGNV